MPPLAATPPIPKTSAGTSTTLYRPCSGANAVTCPSGAAYRVQTTGVDGSLGQFQLADYYDAQTGPVGTNGPTYHCTLLDHSQFWTASP